MKLDGVSFNILWIRKFNTAEEFAGHIGNKHLWPGISEELRKQRLSLVYQYAKRV